MHGLGGQFIENSREIDHQNLIILVYLLSWYFHVTLKELIQNADDAGAKEVKFLYDGRSFGTKFLTTDHLCKYQGPALYAFNDAIFKPEDWDGIQKLMQSNKKHDLLKVGRFGIGFNSVYHLTGLFFFWRKQWLS